MKRELRTLRKFALLSIFLSGDIYSFSQDLPGASANLQIAPAGTLVIAMDNINQATSSINGASGTYLFNLKSYGLAVLVRNAGVNLQWVIRAGKAKDDIDFSATAERISPTYEAAQTRDFRSGPFLVFPADTLGMDNLINWYNSGLSDSCKVKVYRLTADISVDVRYTLINQPRAALLHDSCDIHRNYMEMATVPTQNYDCLPDATTLKSGCYTIVTVPHIVANDLPPSEMDSVYNFVLAGGNLLAECESVQTFENDDRYHSSTGVIVDPAGGMFSNFNNNVYYDNPDMAYAQYQGTFRPWLRGAQKVWRYSGATTNNFYSVTSCKRNAADDLYYVASVSKMTSDTGSMVFYLGNHEYYTHDCHTCVAGALINEQEINGIRMYLNAFMIPAKKPPCVTLDIKLGEFTASRQPDGNVLLNWNMLENNEKTIYHVEYSIDGKNFTVIGRLPSKGITEEQNVYEFTHSVPVSGINYYRLKMNEGNGKQVYSPVRKIIIGKNKLSMGLYPNPATGSVTMQLDVNDGSSLHVKLYDLSGKLVKQNKLTIKNQVTSMKVDDLHNGIYWIVARLSGGEFYKNKLVVLQ